MEGEAIASRILELGPAGAKFLGPVIIEVPHFASLRGKEREIVILRSDNGENWKEHTLEATEEAVQEVLQDSFDEGGEPVFYTFCTAKVVQQKLPPAEKSKLISTFPAVEQSRSARTSNTSYFYSTKSPNVLFAEATQLEDLNTNRITRILTTDFPQYFAIITRIRQEVHAIGPEGGVVNSTVVPQVQAVFPQGALTKKIKVGLQVNMFRPRKAALANGLFKKITVNHVPKKKRFSLIW